MYENNYKIIDHGTRCLPEGTYTIRRVYFKNFENEFSNNTNKMMCLMDEVMENLKSSNDEIFNFFDIFKICVGINCWDIGFTFPFNVTAHFLVTHVQDYIEFSKTEDLNFIKLRFEFLLCSQQSRGMPFKSLDINVI